MSRHETLVFIPAWNEEKNLPAVLDEIATGLPGADVLVVDDGLRGRRAVELVPPSPRRSFSTASGGEIEEVADRVEAP